MNPSAAGEVNALLLYQTRLQSAAAKPLAEQDCGFTKELRSVCVCVCDTVKHANGTGVRTQQNFSRLINIIVFRRRLILELVLLDGGRPSSS